MRECERVRFFYIIKNTLFVKLFSKIKTILSTSQIFNRITTHVFNEIFELHLNIKQKGYNYDLIGYNGNGNKYV